MAHLDDLLPRPANAGDLYIWALQQAYESGIRIYDPDFALAKDPSQRERLAQSGALSFSGDALALPTGATAASPREPVWSYLLAGMLVFMVAELLLAGWSARRRFSPAPQPLPRHGEPVPNA